MRKHIFILTGFLFLSAMVSCVQAVDEPDAATAGTEKLYARIDGNSKAAVTDGGIVSWQKTDDIGVFTSLSNIRVFKVASIESEVALFTAVLQPQEQPQALAVYPAVSFAGLSGDAAQIIYPSEYTYEENAMKAPMAAEMDNGDELMFRHVGGLIRVACPVIPTGAVTFGLVASGRKIAGNFTVPVAEYMYAVTEDAVSGNEVKVRFEEGTSSMAFNVPLPTGHYENISANFYDADDKVLSTHMLYSGLTVERADMFLTSLNHLNGTLIEAGNTRVGIVCDDQGTGIEGVPVTDGYKFVVTDENGVYQFVAHEDSRAVYLSHPAGYELPVDDNGQHMFWSAGPYRNDFVLTKRTLPCDDFSILAFSDVHFYNEGANSTDELVGYNHTVLPDMNAYLSNFENVIAINCGDVVTNCTARLPDSKKEFAKIKSAGKTVPMLMSIGNHDYNNSGSSALECSQDWFDTYGPTDYSVNIGKVHIVCMSNIIYTGNNDGGYGKAIKYDKGLTDEQWEWLKQDLALVENKADKMLILSFHCPVFSNNYAHAADIRNLLKTFGEAHIFSGHNHYNTPRQFTDTWKGLEGRIPYEHNMPALGGLWRGTKKILGTKTEHSSLGNDGTPNCYHVYKVEGNSITARYLKAIGQDASYQFRIYDGGAVYHEPLESKYSSVSGDIDGMFYFDWKTLWESSEGFDPTGCFIVRVFDAGTRGLDCNVYFTRNGVRSEMTRVKATHRDQCTFSYLWNNELLNSNSSYGTAYTGAKTQSFWYIEAPSGSPSLETDWKVEVEFTEKAGIRTYESATIQTDYTGFSHSIY